MTQQKRSSQAWLVAGALVGGGVLFLIVYIAMQSPDGGDEGPASPPVRYRVPLAEAPVKGPPDALVTIVEFSDFQCPHCRVLSQRIQRLFERSPGDVRLAFRHAPLTQAHPHAMAAAAASMAAHEQGRFWPYHDLLFARQDELNEGGRAFLEELARRLRLDIVQFQADMERYEHGNALRVDRSVLVALGQGVVPVLFINGRLVVGAVPLEELVTIVDEERTRAQEALADGVPQDQLYRSLIANGIGPELDGTAPGSEPSPPPPREDGGPGCVMGADAACAVDSSIRDADLDRE